jgi:hypothetical protein
VRALDDGLQLICKSLGCARRSRHAQTGWPRSHIAPEGWLRRLTLRERLRRLWREVTYDPVVELQRAKELLAKRLEWSEAKEHERRKANLTLWRSASSSEDK